GLSHQNSRLLKSYLHWQYFVENSLVLPASPTFFNGLLAISGWSNRPVGASPLRAERPGLGLTTVPARRESPASPDSRARSTSRAGPASRHLRRSPPARGCAPGR